MSRLPFVPGKKALQVDIENGVLSFTPVAEKKLDVPQLIERIEEAGYQVPSVEMIVSGKLISKQNRAILDVPENGVQFILKSDETVEELTRTFPRGSRMKIRGRIVHQGEAPAILVIEEYGSP